MKTCANCGSPQPSSDALFCLHCGQKYHLHLHSFKDTVFHFIADYFHFDNKLWKTLRQLFFNCGQLASNYISGKVASNYNPLSLYIFISAVFFMLYFGMVKYSYTLLKNHPHEYQEQIQWNSFKPLQPSSLEYKDSIYVSPDSAKVLHHLLLQDMEFDINAELTTYFLDIRLLGALRSLQHKPLFSLGNAIEYFTNSFIKDIPKLYFVFVPLLAFILTLSLRKRNYMECLLFAVYFQCLMFLLILITAFLEASIHISYAVSTTLLFVILSVMLSRSLQFFGHLKQHLAILVSVCILVVYYSSLSLLSISYLYLKAYYL